MQYLISISIILASFVFIFYAREIHISPRLSEGLLFFSFLLFFEFSMVLIDPLIEDRTGGFPLPKLVINAVLAFSISIIDNFFESRLKKRLFVSERNA